MNDKATRFERSWPTQRLVDAFGAMEVGESVAKAEMAERCGIELRTLETRHLRAREIALREAHVIVRLIDGCFVRLSQEGAGDVAADYLAGARAKARRVGTVFRHGITDWEKIEGEKRKEMFATQAQAAAIAAIATTRAHRQLSESVECANNKLDIGRTLELLKK